MHEAQRNVEGSIRVVIFLSSFFRLLSVHAVVGCLKIIMRPASVNAASVCAIQRVCGDPPLRYTTVLREDLSLSMMGAEIGGYPTVYLAWIWFGSVLFYSSTLV